MLFENRKGIILSVKQLNKKGLNNCWKIVIFINETKLYTG